MKVSSSCPRWLPASGGVRSGSSGPTSSVCWKRQPRLRLLLASEVAIAASASGAGTRCSIDDHARRQEGDDQPEHAAGNHVDNGTNNGGNGHTPYHCPDELTVAQPEPLAARIVGDSVHAAPPGSSCPLFLTSSPRSSRRGQCHTSSKGFRWTSELVHHALPTTTRRRAGRSISGSADLGVLLRAC